MDQREEFIGEAQEIIEGLSRDLLALDGGVRRGEPADPELVNDAFRAVHTLKGLSGLFGVARMSTLSHHLEDVLDDLRLGRSVLDPRLLDVMFRAVEVYHQILAALRQGEPEPQRSVEELLMLLDSVVSVESRTNVDDPVTEYELDPGLLAVLTEYEEHRLRTNLQQGLELFTLQVVFPLASIDASLDALKTRARPHGEILTYLPSGSGGDADTIALDVLLASPRNLDELTNIFRGSMPPVGSTSLQIQRVGRRTQRRPAVAQPQPTTAGKHPAAAPPQPVSSAVSTRQPTGTGDGIDLESEGGPPTPRGMRHQAPEAKEPPVHSEAPKHAAVATAEAPLAAATIRGVAQTVRVDIRKLDHLMNIVAELAIVRGALGRMSERVRADPQLRSLAGELHRMHRSLDRHLGELQSGILEVRMVPLGQVFDKLARVVRQIGREHDKDIHLVITGAETEVDKLIVEELSDPLMHMVRNAIDHGIEARSQRVNKAKPEAGTIALNAYQKGNHVVIEVQDDGAGIDENKVRAQAVRRGLVTETEAAALVQREILGFIFLPGFSTKEGVNELSGRGVGMDIVKTNISRMGGVIDVQSELGIGTKMTVTLPITLAIISALVVVVGGRRYAIPLASVLEALQFDPHAVRSVEGREVMNLRGTTLALVRLEQMFGLPPAVPDPLQNSPEGKRSGWTDRWSDGRSRFSRESRRELGSRRYVVVVGAGALRLGCVVDQLIGQQDIVIKPLGKTLASVRGFAGATELGDQIVGLVLDAPALMEEVLSPGEAGRLLGMRRGAGEA